MASLEQTPEAEYGEGLAVGRGLPSWQAVRFTYYPAKHTTRPNQPHVIRSCLR